MQVMQLRRVDLWKTNMNCPTAVTLFGYFIGTFKLNG